MTGARTAPTRCSGLAGLVFGHRYTEVYDEKREYYPTDDRLRSEGPLKSETREHQYCVCRRCGAQISRERRSLFTNGEAK